MIFEKKDLQSNFVASLGMKNNKKVDEELIAPLIKDFFNQRGVSYFKELDVDSCISDKDFKHENFNDFFKFFYEKIVYDIYKEDMDVEVVTKYCVTFDKQNCLEKCEDTGVFYDEIMLNDKPVFYFIYVDIEDVFNFLRKSVF